MKSYFGNDLEGIGQKECVNSNNFDFVVLGATGMQGRIVSKDLLENNYRVLLCGRDKSRLDPIFKRYKNCCFTFFDAEDISNTTKIIKMSGAKVVINCVEGNWNLNILKSCMKAKVNCLDLGSEIWMTKEQISLHQVMKKNNIVSITGCGSVPGIGNIMLRYAAEKFDNIRTIEVGFSWDSNIKKFVVPFSIQSILEEFEDPAPVIEETKLVRRNPLETVTEDYFRGIGRQKCFFVRHPETYTFYKYFKNKGVKNVRFYAGFPQHSFDKIMTLIELGLSKREEIDFKGMKIKPVEFLSEVLKTINIPEGYKEKENLWLNVEGTKDGKEKKLLLECIVPTLKNWEEAGCNIDTGMPASIIAQMIKNGVIKDKGSFAPEAVIPPELFFKELRNRKMIIFENGKIIN